MKNFKHELWQSARTLILLGVLFTGASYVLAQTTWVGPSGPPPTNNTPPPVNVGGVTQVKSGGLGVADFVADSVTVGATANFAAVTSPRFCIGTACITAWPTGGGGAWVTVPPGHSYMSSPVSGWVVDANIPPEQWCQQNGYAGTSGQCKFHNSSNASAEGALVANDFGTGVIRVWNWGCIWDGNGGSFVDAQTQIYCYGRN